MPISIYGEKNPALHTFMPDRYGTVWRYTDIGKYLDLITRRELWFTRVSTLRSMDPYEGSLTSYDVEKTTKILAAATPAELKTALLHYSETGIAEMMDKVLGKSHWYFQLVYLLRLPLVDVKLYTHSVSCWHSNATESDAMWELYAKRAAGVAIKSSVARLLKAFESSKRNLSIAKVNYDSHNQLSALTSGVFDSFLIKRHAFRHEDEIRIIALTSDGYETPEWTETNQIYRIDPSRPVPPGYYIACDLHALIEEVVISPLMPAHAYEALGKVSKRYLPEVPVRRSSLLTKEDIPLKASPELALMWNEFQKTRLLRDLTEITRGDEAANSQG